MSEVKLVETNSEVILLGIFEHAYPVDIFIQHVRNLRHLQIKGDITIQSIQDAMEDKWSSNEELLMAGKDFIAFQLENGAEMSSVVHKADSEDEISVLHFDFIQG